MAKLGPQIGKIGSKNRHKKHSPYRKSRRLSTPIVRRRMSGASGFEWLEAGGTYDVNLKKLIVTISARRRASNLGPGLYFKRSFAWSRKQNETGSLPEKLNDVLDDIEGQVLGRKFPKSDMFLERCNNTGMDPGEFMESTCMNCICWYCELSE